MKRLAPVIAVVVIVAALSLAVLAGGCGSGGNAATLPGDGDATPEVRVKEAFTSAVLDEEGLPVAGAGVFSPDTPEIYLYFELVEDLCCQTVTVQWWHEGKVIKSWAEEDSTDGIFTVALEQPDGGFGAGDYSVRVYVLVEELIHIGFTVE
jgi:hypothetical protein